MSRVRYNQRDRLPYLGGRIVQKQEILAAKGLARVVDDLEVLTTDSIRATTRPGDVPVGTSHLGGWPDLPEDVPWPAWDGKPLGFIAQFNLADVHPFDPQNLLPSMGVLYFFYDATGETYGERLEDRSGWKVMYSESHALKRVQATLPDSGRFRSCAVDFSKEVTLPLRPEVFGRGANWTSAEHTAYETLTSSQQGIKNRLLGHADAIQDDMHVQAYLLAKGQPLDTPLSEALQRAAQNWILLFQADSDVNAGMRWANNGRLYYWIERQALQARQFDQVWMILQSE